MAGRNANTNEESTASSTARVLGANLQALMGKNTALSSNPKLASKTKLGTGTISRLRNGQVDANLMTLEVLAAAFDLQPWQLLVPNMDPRNPPVLLSASESERKLYESFLKVAKEMKEGA